MYIIEEERICDLPAVSTALAAASLPDEPSLSEASKSVSSFLALFLPLTIGALSVGSVLTVASFSVTWKAILINDNTVTSDIELIVFPDAVMLDAKAFTNEIINNEPLGVIEPTPTSVIQLKKSSDISDNKVQETTRKKPPEPTDIPAPAMPTNLQLITQ